ncbi:hypothetical protein ACJ41P_32320 [Azospirillum argentinense]|uniref:Core-binding (CB) domain-containing protein n=1 Tax=Azospirillum argentinense TaxID=2970906 RepID=A0ABW8VHD3_9PROT
MLKVKIPTHARRYSFDKIAERYGISFARSLMEMWGSLSGAARYSSSSAYDIYIALRKILLWISYSDATACRSVFFALSHGIEPSQTDWRHVLLAYRALIIDQGELKRSTKASKISNINSAAGFLFYCGIVPETPPLKHPIGVNAAKTPRPSLAFLTRSGTKESCTQDINVTLHNDDALGPNFNLEARARVMESLNESRLSELMMVSEKSFLSCYDDFLRGKMLMGMDISNFYINEVNSICSLSDDVFLSCVLKSIAACEGKFCWETWFWQQRKSVRTRLSKLGGRHHLNRFMGGTVDGVIALETILLCETGLNVEVIEALFYDFTSKAVAGRRRISTIGAAKLRANGNVAEGDLVRDREAWLTVGRAGRLVSGVRAIGMWLDMTEAMRARADRQTAEYLLLIPSGFGWDGNVRPARVARGQMAGAWKRLLASNIDNPVIGGLSIRRTSIRPSVAQIIDSRADFDTLSAKVWLNHSRSKVTWTYLNVPWMRRELDRQIRHFQQLLESTLASGLRDIARELEISQEELAHRKRLAKETGLGTLCLDAYSGIQPGTQQGQLCDRLDRCASGCRLMRFVPTDSSLQALVAFNKALRCSENVWVQSRPERWVEAWLPWLALTEAALRTLQKSPVYRKKLNVAIRATEDALRSGKIYLFEPY